MGKTIDMAREAGFVENAGNVYGDHVNLNRFEALIRADERARLQPKKIKAREDDYCHGDERYYANE